MLAEQRESMVMKSCLLAKGSLLLLPPTIAFPKQFTSRYYQNFVLSTSESRRGDPLIPFSASGCSLAAEIPASSPSMASSLPR
jgi:hypothetical protein